MMTGDPWRHGGSKSFLARGIWSFAVAIQDEFRLHFGYGAAAISFFTILSVVPLIIASSTLLSFLPIHHHFIQEAIQTLLPNATFDAELIAQRIQAVLAENRGVYGIGSFILAYYFSSTLFLAFRRALGEIFDLKPSKIAHFWVTLLSVPMVILGLVSVYIALILVNVLIDMLNQFQWIQPLFFGSDLAALVGILGILPLFSFFIITFLIYHGLCPRKSHVVKNSLFISAVTSAILTLFQKGVGLFLGVATKWNPLYGGFGGILGILTWIFISYIVIFIGARALYHLDEY